MAQSVISARPPQKSHAQSSKSNPHEISEQVGSICGGPLRRRGVMFEKVVAAFAALPPSGRLRRSLLSGINQAARAADTAARSSKRMKLAILCP